MRPSSRRWPQLGVLALISLAACHDAPLAPAVPEDMPSALPAFRASRGWDMILTKITVHPNGRGRDRSVFVIGREHRIVFPRRSICDPDRSTFGPSEWDAPCEPLTRPITITAYSWHDADGHPQVYFSPDLRFVPSSDPSRWVILELLDRTAVLDPAASILWCPSVDRCVEEALGDPTLRTYRDESTGYLTRRLKHFSGYLVSANRKATD
jgi:hypothetical protein